MSQIELPKNDEYWQLSPKEKGRFWVDIISNGLGISPYEAGKKILHNNSLPLEESEGLPYPVYTRFNAHLSLLAEASPDSPGPSNRPRPTLATWPNILKISGLSRRRTMYYQKKVLASIGETGQLLLDARLTASNPKSAPTGTYFSNDDIIKGVYIPSQIDIPTARALGVIFAKGGPLVTDESYFYILSSDRTKDFFAGPVRAAFAQAFNFFEDKYISSSNRTTEFQPEGVITSRLNYSSMALRTYLQNFVGYPGSIDERRETGLPSNIKEMHRSLQNEFLKYFLCSAANYRNKRKGQMYIRDYSKPLLEDIRQMISAEISHPVREPIFVPTPKGTSVYALIIEGISTTELMLRGYLKPNPELENVSKEIWEKRCARKSPRDTVQQYFRRKYGSLIPSLAG